jgi:predicted dehydrogenase
LRTGIQTARKAVADGLIGRPLAASATMVTAGHERWHPAPEFYYRPGGGPLFDMGPYYLTALVSMLGPVESVVAAAGRSRSRRRISAGPRAGADFAVEVDTHVSGVLRHRGGALTSLLMSFDAVATRAPKLEIHGEEGSLIAPDPNRFAGDVELRRLGDAEWRTLPESAGYRGAGRGCGLADIAAHPELDEPRASASVAYHVLETMEGLLASARTGAAVPVTSTFALPPLVDLGALR